MHIKISFLIILNLNQIQKEALLNIVFIKRLKLNMQQRYALVEEKKNE